MEATLLPCKIGKLESYLEFPSISLIEKDFILIRDMISTQRHKFNPSILNFLLSKVKSAGRARFSTRCNGCNQHSI